MIGRYEVRKLGSGEAIKRGGERARGWEAIKLGS